MKITQRSVADLVPYAQNARTHSEAQVAQLAASIEEFGWTNPVLVDGDNGIIAGHGRVIAALKLGQAKVPCIEIAHLSEEQRRAYIIADNRLAENAGWDKPVLALELAELTAADFDTSLIGFDPADLDTLLAFVPPNDGLTDPDAVPAEQERIVSAPEALWRLGRHRLLCGDATDLATVSRLMDAGKASLLFTSPPYAQQRDYGAAKEKISDWDALMQGVFAAAPVTDAAQLLVNLGLVHRDGEWVPYWDSWIAWMRGQGWRRFGWYVWDQGPGLPGNWNGRLAPSHEFIFHFNRQPQQPNKTVESKHAGETLGGGGLRGADGKVHRKTGYGNAIQSHRIPDSVFRVMRHKGGLGAVGSHPAVFPVVLVESVLEAFTDPGNLVFEPFCGAGTQLIAAERTGRRCFGMELHPVYCDVAVRRWQEFTGEAATLDGDGRTFDEIALERQEAA